MLERILIANRGEIAQRIIRTCKRMGIWTLAVYSEADSRSGHSTQADASICLGDSPAQQSYLATEKILDAALAHRCQAVHPGYGFLSENASFAQRVQEAGLVFIGPPAPVITALGDKIESKRLAHEAGLPVVPGPLHELSGLDEVLANGEETGYPVLLKPARGGGGKGMRVARRREDVKSAVAACQAEARKAFGDEGIFLERYIPKSRHVEVQILADAQGNVIHLGERECSIQRRYQKIIEETPSLAVDASLRRTLGRRACDLARKTGYTNAGTVEFILDPEGNFYFLEVNTRLQVEHPTTEMVTSLDLVELQIRIAGGEPLSLEQEEVSLNGWAIEARVCAEDPAREFYPSSGMVTRYYQPKGPHVRVDSGIEAGSLVSIYYDSLLAKVIAWGPDREEARSVLVDALNGYHIEGMATNLVFLNAVLNHPAFVRGDLSTRFIDEHFEGDRSTSPPPREHLHYMALAATLVHHNRQNLVRESLKPMAAQVGGAPKSKPHHDYRVKGDNHAFALRLQETGPETHAWTVWVDGTPYEVKTPRFEFYRRRLKLEIEGRFHRFLLQYRGNFVWTAFSGIAQTFEIYSPLEWKLTGFVPTPPVKAPEDLLRCPMPGIIVEILAQEGERVSRGQELALLESMKMQSGVASPCDATVQRVMVKKGQTVERGDILFAFRT